MLFAVVSVGQVVRAQLECYDAARAGARTAARGEPSARVLRTASLAAPSGALVREIRTSTTVRVQVGATVRLPLPARPGIRVGAVATADVEHLDPGSFPTGTGVP
jgi:Flp pilus assembly protein TadG